MAGIRLASGFVQPRAAILLLLASVLAPRASSGQELTGLVRDAATGEAVPQATVMQLREGMAQRSASTGHDGRFRLRVDPGFPVVLQVERLGYAPFEVTLEVKEALQGVLEILLEPQALRLPEVQAEVERDELDFHIGGWRVTESGMYSPGSPGRCYYPILDSVVVRDPRLLRPEVVQRYGPARAYFAGRSAYSGTWAEHIRDPRVQRDAWPCGTVRIMRTAGLPTRFDRSRPESDAPRYELDPEAVHHFDVDLPGPRLGPRRLAIGTDGVVAVISPDGAFFELLSGDGGSSTRPLGANDSPGPREGTTTLGEALQLGWLGDTVWVADHLRGTLTLVPGEEEAIVRAREGILAPSPEGPALASVDEALAAPLSMDRPAPVPAADGRFLWTRPAPDPPFPPRHEDDPPGRFLVVLGPNWQVERVLATLRPGAEPIRIELGERPVIGEQPFRDPPIWALSPRGEHVTVVHREHQVAAWLGVYRVVRLTLEGDTVFSVEREAPLVRLSREAFTAAQERLAEHPAARNLMRNDVMRPLVVGSLLYRPPFHPPISALAVGRDGTTWLRWPDAEDLVRWDVLDARGHPIHTLRIDRDVEILDADGGTVWGLRPAPDGGGVEVVRFRLRAASTGSKP